MSLLLLLASAWLLPAVLLVGAYDIFFLCILALIRCYSRSRLPSKHSFFVPYSSRSCPCTRTSLVPNVLAAFLVGVCGIHPLDTHCTTGVCGSNCPHYPWFLLVFSGDSRTVSDSRPNVGARVAPFVPCTCEVSIPRLQL